MGYAGHPGPWCLVLYPTHCSPGGGFLWLGSWPDDRGGAVSRHPDCVLGPMFWGYLARNETE